MKSIAIKTIKWISFLLLASIVMVVINEFKAVTTKRIVAEHLEAAGMGKGSPAQAAPTKKEYDDFEYYGDWWVWSGHESGDSHYISGTTTPEKLVLMLTCGTSNLSCDYLAVLPSKCDTKFEKVNLKMGEESVAVAAECDGVASEETASYTINIKDFLYLGDAEGTDTLTVTVKGGTDRGDVTNFSLLGAKEAINHMTKDMGASSSSPKDMQNALLLVKDKIKSSDDVIKVINSIPDLKKWFDSDSPEFGRAVEIDDELKVSPGYQDLPLRERFLIVVDRVKREQTNL